MTRLLISSTPLTALLPHCLLSSLTAPPARARPCSSLLPLHPLAFLPCLHGGKVDVSGHLYGEVFHGYKILHGRVSLDDELHAGGVALLVTSSSMVAGLLHRQAQHRICTLRWVMLWYVICYNSQS